MADITIRVTNAEELRAALVNATGGETIELEGGDYGELDLQTFKTFGVKAIYDTPVTITSADPNHRASFSEMDLREVKNLTFDNVVFDSNYTGGAVWVSPFMILDSEGVTIRNSLFEGELASGTGDPTTDGFATGKGLRIEGSSGIVVENNEFTTWHRALTVGGSTDVSVVGNDVHSIRSDGMNFAHVQNVLIENNHIHDFALSKASADHSDMIQFWTTGGTVPSENIIIRGNTLDMGDGDLTQSIFMRNEVVDQGLAGREMFYRNILIEQNVILNSHSHGITVGETDALTIRKNTVLPISRDDEDFGMVPRINVAGASTNVVIEQNAVGGISGFGGQENWRVGSNVIVQNADIALDGHVETQFVTSSLRTGSAADLRVLPDSLVAQLGAGADRLSGDYPSGAVAPLFSVTTSADDVATLVFDASFSVGPDGKPLPADARYVWEFGDGSTAEGVRVAHAFATAGRFDTKLSVVLPDGTTHATSAQIGLSGVDVVSFDASTGEFSKHAFGESTSIDSSGANIVDTNTGKVIDLGAPGVAASVAKEDIQRFFGAEAFEITMTVQADKPLQSAGEVARIHGSFIMKIDQSGVLTTTLFTDDGAVEVKTSGVRLNDGQAHDIMLRFDGEADEVEVLVDGSVAGSASVTGEMPVMQHWGLVFGNPWGDPNFDGKLSAFGIASEINDFPIDDGPVIVDADAEETQTEISPPAEDATVIDEPESDPDPVAEPEVDGQPEEDSKVLPEGEDSGALDPVEGVIGEVHKIVLDHNETVLQLDNSFENPVVIAHVASMNGGQPVTVRLNQVSSNEVRLSLQEPNYLDGKHLPEDVIVMVLEAGVHELADGTRIEAGTLESDKLTSAGFESVAFDRGFEERPVILSQAQTRNGGDFVVTRQDGADANGFRLAMQEEEALNGGGHLSETLGWVAIEPGAGDWFGVPFVAGTTGDQVGHKAVQQSFGTTFAEEPLVLASLASHDGADTAWAVATGVTRDGFSAHVREETSSDRETAHTRETVDFLAFGGTGTLRGLSADATPLEAELVSGVNDSSVPEDDLYDFTLDIAALGSDGSTATLVDDAHVVTGIDGLSVRMDGDKDFVALGRLHEFETSSQLTFDVTFQRENPDTGAERLVWNHLKTGLTIEGDNLRIHVASPDRSFSDGFVIRNAGVLDAEEHNARVIIDSDVDRLQVVLDGEVVLDEQGVDLDLTADAGRQWGWSLGTAWDRFFEGEVSDFRIDAEARFIDELNDQSDGTVLASA